MTQPTSAQLRDKVASINRSTEAIGLDIATRTEALANATDDASMATESGAIAKLHEQKRVMLDVRRLAEQRVADAEARESREALLAKVAALEGLQDERVSASVELQGLLPRVAELIVNIYRAQERCQQLAALPNRVLSKTGWHVNEVQNITVGDTAATLVNDMLSTLAVGHWPFGEKRGADLVATVKRQRVQYLAFVAAATGTDEATPAAIEPVPSTSVHRLRPMQSGPLEGATLIGGESIDAVDASREALMRERAAATA